MEWIKASVLTTTYGTEAVTGLLIANGIVGMEIVDAWDRKSHFEGVARTWDYVDESLLDVEGEGAYVVFYVPGDAAGDLILESVRRGLEWLRGSEGGAGDCDMGALTLGLEAANDENWLHEWKKHFKPLRIGNIVVVPEWVEYSPGVEDGSEIVFIIDPGSAFGTGQHQTTQLCVVALQEWLSSGDRVLDVGCGSGILSVISLLLGAESVCAVDVDPAGAVSATKKNASLNGIDMERLRVCAGDVLTDEGFRRAVCAGGYDVVVANIVADVVGALASIVLEFLNPDGLFIASGIIDERLDDVLSAFSDGGLSLVWQKELEGWHCVVGKRDA